MQTAKALQDLGVRYVQQKTISHYAVDFYLPDSNAVIECQGDYWHCNPAVYPNGPINTMQRDRIRIDASKRTLLKNRGHKLVYLWESDIKAKGAVALLKAALHLT
jgi:very-short-patch-repair endonuclease